MKRLTVKLSYKELVAVDEWLACFFEDVNYSEISFGEKCVVATLIDWRITKVNPKTLIRTAGKTALKLDAQTAMALAHIITINELEPHTQIGNKLLQISASIDQHFK